jgi:hypothetical protein
MLYCISSPLSFPVAHQLNDSLEPRGALDEVVGGGQPCQLSSGPFLFSLLARLCYSVFCFNWGVATDSRLAMVVSSARVSSLSHITRFQSSQRKSATFSTRSSRVQLMRGLRARVALNQACWCCPAVAGLPGSSGAGCSETSRAWWGEIVARVGW